jgi:hypothetical protein
LTRRPAAPSSSTKRNTSSTRASGKLADLLSMRSDRDRNGPDENPLPRAPPRSAKPAESAPSTDEHRRATAARRSQPEQHPQRRRLASTFRTQETGDRAPASANDNESTASTEPNRFVTPQPPPPHQKQQALPL